MITGYIKKYDIKTIDDLPLHARSLFQFYYVRMNKLEKLRFAKRVGVGAVMVKTNWIRPMKKPLSTHYTLLKVTSGRPPNYMFEVIARATDGYCTFVDIREHFCPDIPEHLKRVPRRLKRIRKK